MTIPNRFRTFTADDVRAMREETGDGMMTCKRRLIFDRAEQALAQVSDPLLYDLFALLIADARGSI